LLDYLDREHSRSFADLFAMRAQQSRLRSLGPVGQLQKQLSEKQTEMDAMQKSMQAGNIPRVTPDNAAAHATMQTLRQQMHAGGCGVYPSGYGCGGAMGRAY